jgi:membrane-bound ClpP family serine protease
MALKRRTWTAKEAEEWTKEDTIAVIISPIVYILLMVGCALSVLTMWQGYVIFGAGIALLVVLVFVINPKLSAVSEGYERKQKEYIEDLERRVKWEE